VFWRGANSGSSYDPVDVWSDTAKYYPRMELVKMSIAHPDRIDAMLVSFRSPQEK